MMVRELTRWMLVVLIGLGASLSAHAISDSQIEQLRELPREQQQALAEEHGFDLDDFESGTAPDQSRPEDVEVVHTPLSDPDPEAVEDDELKPFGYDLFEGRPSTFAPVTEIPLPSEYIIGPGDVIHLQLYGNENDQLELPVGRDGTIQMPDTGPIPVAGLSLQEVRDQLGHEVREKFIGTEANVSLGELRSMRIFVLGEARSPGSYTVSALSTVTNALFVSGGVLESGSLREVQVLRDGEVVGRLDLYELLLEGDTSADMRLEPGDAIFIPPVGDTAAIDGEVQRPAIYEFREGQSLEDLVDMAGGYTRDADSSHVQVERIDGRTRRQLESVDLTDADAAERALKAGDRLDVPVLSELSEGFVQVRGQATRTGEREWREGMRLSEILRERRRDLKEDVDLNYGLIVRETGDEGHIRIKQFRPVSVLRDTDSADNRVLEDRDEILFFSRREGGALEEDEYERERRERAGERSERSRAPEQPFDRESPRDRRSAQQQDEEDQEETAGRPLLKDVIERLQRQAGPDEQLRVVAIEGAVRHPGDYPLPEGATAEDLIRAAGGLEDSALMLDAEVTRVGVTEQGQADPERLSFPLFAGAETGADSIALKGRDRLFIKRIPGFAERDTISLEGEVRFPGEYTVQPDDTLSDIVERAGGLTDRAFAEGAVFSRERLRRLESERLEDAERRLRRDLMGLQLEAGEDDVSPEDIGALQRMLDNVQQTEAAGRLVIDLEGLLEGSREPLEVVDGDSLEVPRRPQSVSVFGEVQFASSHLYESGMTVSDYLESSGGLTSQADSERIYVVRADGSVWRPERSRWYAGRGEELRPGDTIIAPIDVDRINQLQLWTNVSQVFSNLAISAASLSNL